MDQSKQKIFKKKELFTRRLLYVTLLSVAPAFIFLIQAVTFIPPLNILSSAAQMVWLIATDTEREPSMYMILLLAHFVLSAVFYWVVAFLLARLVTFFQVRSTRILMTLSILVALAAITQLSWYGSGGHGASQLGPIQSLLYTNSKGFDPNSIAYISTVVFFAVMTGLLHWYRQQR